jgi:hypothetical protein
VRTELGGVFGAGEYDVVSTILVKGRGYGFWSCVCRPGGVRAGEGTAKRPIGAPCLRSGVAAPFTSAQCLRSNQLRWSP